MHRLSCFGALLVICLVALSACGSGGASLTGDAASRGATTLAGARHLIAVAQEARVHQLRVFSQCVRAHGVPDYPNPNRHGVLPSARLRVIHDSPLASHENVAVGSCAHLLQGHNTAPLIGFRLPAQTQRRYVACLRTHGLPHFAFSQSASKAAAMSWTRYVDTHRAALKHATHVCGHLLPHL